jgi:hypothetical protein
MFAWLVAGQEMKRLKDGALYGRRKRMLPEHDAADCRRTVLLVIRDKQNMSTPVRGLQLGCPSSG